MTDRKIKTRQNKKRSGRHNNKRKEIKSKPIK